MLDTGAQATAIDSHFAARTRLHLGRPVELEGRGGYAGARWSPGLTLNLGAATGRVDAVVADLGDEGRAMGVPLDGILGEDFLRRFIVTLDYGRQTVALVPPEAAAAPPADAAPLRFNVLPYVRARVSRAGHSVDAEFQVDTGSNTAVEFWGPFAQQAFPGARGAPGIGMGVAGDASILRGRIDSLQVAGRQSGPLVVNLADETRPNGAGADYAGVIGGPAWAGLALTLDVPRGKLWVR
jgi:hypothetical protein